MWFFSLLSLALALTTTPPLSLRPPPPPPPPFSAVETFSGAAHGVAESGDSASYSTTNHRAALGLVLQRALLIAAAMTALATLLWAGAGGSILTHLLRQPPATSAGAAAFAARWAPALLLWGISEACRRTAVVQGGVKACAAVSGVVCLAARPLTAWLVGVGDARTAPRLLPSALAGSAAADTAMAALSAAGMAGVVALLDAGREPGDRAWNGWQVRAVLSDGRAWRAHARVALPAAALVCLIWWAGQATVLLAGALPTAPDTALAAAGVLLNVRAASFMLNDGLAGAAAVRVAVDLGAGSPRAAATAAAAAGASGAVVGALLGGVAVAAVRGWAPALCPAAGGCVRVVTAAVPMLSLAMASDAAGGALAGGLRGCGRQKTAAGIALAGGWVVGVPLQAWLASGRAPRGRPPWLGPGVPGLIAGSALASAAQAVALLVAVRRLDWGREAGRSARRARRAGVVGEEEEGEEGGLVTGLLVGG